MQPHAAISSPLRDRQSQTYPSPAACLWREGSMCGVSLLRGERERGRERERETERERSEILVSDDGDWCGSALGGSERNGRTRPRAKRNGRMPPLSPPSRKVGRSKFHPYPCESVKHTKRRGKPGLRQPPMQFCGCSLDSDPAQAYRSQSRRGPSGVVEAVAEKHVQALTPSPSPRTASAQCSRSLGEWPTLSKAKERIQKTRAD